MTSLQDLHDPTKTCITIEAREDSDDVDESPDYEPFESRDITGGYELRFQAYREAWQKCLNRVQAIVHELNEPLVEKVVSYVQDAHTESGTLPNLPYPEVPVVGISAPGGCSTILSNVLDVLHHSENDHATHQPTPKTIVSHIHPAACPNMVALMKALVTGFVDRHGDEDEDEDDSLGLATTKRKATASLANYDIRLLVAWYKALLQVQDPAPRLVVVLHGFEQFDVSVIQDMFYICSQHIHTVPLVFLLELSSPSNPSYLHTTFTRSTLALLCLQVVSAPSGIEVVRNIIYKTFFDVAFEPDVMLGPATLDYLADYTTRNTASVDVLLDILQLAYLKHFEEPLTIFSRNSLLGCRSEKSATKLLERPESFQFLDTLLTRTWHDIENLPDNFPQPTVDWQQPSIPDLLKIVSHARTESTRRTEHMRLGFQVMTIAQDFVTSVAEKKDVPSAGHRLGRLGEIARGRANRDIKELTKAIGKLSGEQLKSLLVKLHELFESLDATLRREEQNARVRIVTTNSQITPEILQEETKGSEHHAAVRPLTTGIAEWLADYLETKLVRLDQGVLWDIWNTGMTPFPSELLNPAPRPTIINALLHPHDAITAQNEIVGNLNSGDEKFSEDQQMPELWELPDTSILFRRYMEAGKRINVFDWYESFALALETQRQQLRKRERRAQQSRRGRGRGKARRPPKRRADSDDENAGFDSKEDKEKWNVQVQARFIQSLHELDFMGFIKHTNRKADHVMRTVYDILD